eukprot:15232593-Alexandrium_andersonii.AAC.1
MCIRDRTSGDLRRPPQTTRATEAPQSHPQLPARAAEAPQSHPQLPGALGPSSEPSSSPEPCTAL